MVLELNLGLNPYFTIQWHRQHNPNPVSTAAWWCHRSVICTTLSCSNSPSGNSLWTPFLVLICLMFPFPLLMFTFGQLIHSLLQKWAVCKEMNAELSYQVNKIYFNTNTWLPVIHSFPKQFIPPRILLHPTVKVQGRKRKSTGTIQSSSIPDRKLQVSISFRKSQEIPSCSLGVASA